MRSASPHTGINSPGLVRFLAGLDILQPGPAAPKGADRLGDWLDWTDAIALSAALDAMAGPAPAGPATGRQPLAQALAQACDAARAALAQAIAGEPAFKPVAPATPASAADIAADAALCRQACQRHQRAAQDAVARLREQARDALGAANPALARLARLDALMDRALAGRERQLLAALPALLERQARHEHAHPDAGPGWAGHGPRLRQALLAELDLRLQPVLGLLQALQQAPEARS